MSSDCITFINGNYKGIKLYIGTVHTHRCRGLGGVGGWIKKLSSIMTCRISCVSTLGLCFHEKRKSPKY